MDTPLPPPTSAPPTPVMVQQLERIEQHVQHLDRLVTRHIRWGQIRLALAILVQLAWYGAIAYGAWRAYQLFDEFTHRPLLIDSSTTQKLRDSLPSLPDFTLPDFQLPQ